MRHYIEVTRLTMDGDESRRVLVGTNKILTVAEGREGCRIYLQGYSFGVTESYEGVRARLRDAEQERI